MTNNTFVFVTLRGLGFHNDPGTLPDFWMKPPTHHAPTVGFRTISHFRQDLP
jgi:hypothetical protein